MNNNDNSEEPESCPDEEHALFETHSPSDTASPGANGDTRGSEPGMTLKSFAHGLLSHARKHWPKYLFVVATVCAVSVLVAISLEKSERILITFLASLAGIAASAYTLLLRYLDQGGRDSFVEATGLLYFSPELSKIEQRIKNLEIDVSSLTKLSQEDSSSLVEAIHQKINNTAGDSYLKSLELRSKLIAQLKQRSRHHLSSLNRIREEVKSLGRRSSVSLLSGLSLVAVAVVWLAVVAYYNDASRSFASHLASFLPNLTAVILLEAAAFFLLRVHRQCLDDIKRFQNEATNLELKFFAAQEATINQDEELMAKIAYEFATTDRNAVLAREQLAGSRKSGNSESVSVPAKDFLELTKEFARNGAAKGK